MGSEAESLSWADTAFCRHAKAQETGGWYWSLSSGLQAEVTPPKPGEEPVFVPVPRVGSRDVYTALQV